MTTLSVSEIVTADDRRWILRVSAEGPPSVTFVEVYAAEEGSFQLAAAYGLDDRRAEEAFWRELEKVKETPLPAEPPALPVAAMPPG